MSLRSFKVTQGHDGKQLGSV